MDKKLEDAVKKWETAEAKGSSSADVYEEEVRKLKIQIAKEKSRPPPPHPALQFGPPQQTIASMAIISLGMSVFDLPYQMIPFFKLFTQITIIAVVCLVTYSSIIWYGYNEEIKKIPQEKSEAEMKLAKLMKRKPDRPDEWAHTRSHPSAFLTTKHAPPKLFPFPLGKTKPEASVKDELWWEGGNAPHVGHFNKPKLPAPPAGPDETILLQRVKKGMEIDAQRELWKRRIRGIQYLSCIIIIYLLNSRIAILALCWLIYSTLAREIENMLKPQMELDKIYDYIDGMSGGRNQSQPKSDLKKRIPAGGMTYIYDPSSADKSGVEHNSNIRIVDVPAPVLMTTTNHWYAGP